MSNAIKLYLEEVKTIAAAAIGPAYMGIGTAFEEPARRITIENATDVELEFSMDGLHNHFVLPTDALMSLDVTTNSAVSACFFIARGDRLYVRGAPTRGAVYVTAYQDKES